MVNFDFGSSDLRQWVGFILGSVINVVIYAVCSPILTIAIMAILMFVPQAQNIVVAVKERSFEPLRIQMGMSRIGFYTMVVKNNMIILMNCIIISIYGAMQMHWGWSALKIALDALHCSAAMSFVA